MLHTLQEIFKKKLIFFYVRKPWLLHRAVHQVIWRNTYVMTGLGLESPDYRWQFFEPSVQMLLIFLIQSLFEGIKDHAVRPFDLAVGSRMSNEDIFDGDATVFAEVPKVMASKCSSEVGDDAVGGTKSMDDIFEELDCFLCSSRDERFIFNPLGELVDGDIHIPETTWRWLERPNHV